MSIQTVNGEILAGSFTNDQLTSIIDAIKFARSRLTQQNMRGLGIGDTVNWTSARTGVNVTGVVVKIAIKYVTVKTVQGLWRVPAGMLTRVEEQFA